METRSAGRPSVAAPSPETLGRAVSAVRTAKALEASGDTGAAAEQIEAAIAQLGALGVLAHPLADLLERLGRQRELARLCGDAASACTDPREAAGWHLRRGQACESAGDTESAIAAYGASLAARPRHPAALEALQRLHRARGDWASLARALEEELALRAGPEEIPLRLELAQILETHLAQPGDALVHLRRAVDLDRGSDETLARALALADSLGAAAHEVPLLEVALERSTGARERARLLARQAALLAGPLVSPGAAAPRWREALQLDPALQCAHEGLRATLEQLGDWPALLTCLLDAARGVGDGARRALLERAACIASEHLGADAALPWLERLRGEAPRDAALVARIASLHRSAGRVGALQASLEAELALGPEPERARVLEAERDALLSAIRGSRPPGPPCEAQPELTRSDGTPGRRSHGPARRAARGIPVRAARPPRLGAETTLPSRDSVACGDTTVSLDAKAAAAAAEGELASLDPAAPVYAERRRALGQRLAHLYADSLGDAERALPHLRALVDADPAMRGVTAMDAERAWAQERLLALLRADGNAPELAQRLAAQLAQAPDDAAGWLELGELEERQLFSPAGAAQAYREALARGAPRLRALQGLRRAAEQLGDWAEAAQAIEGEIAEQTEPAHRSSLLRALGEIAWRHLGATTRASRAFAAALENDPHDITSLRALQQLLASMEDWRGALDLVESEVELLPRDAHTAQRALWLRAARIATERLRDFERAIRALDAAAALAPLCHDERMLLAECLWSAGDLARYVEVAAVVCDEPSVAPNAEAVLRLARALHDLGHSERARSHCKRALTIDPEIAGAWGLLADIRLAQGFAADAAECLVRAAERTGPRAAVEHLLRAAALIESRDPPYAHALREHACQRDAGSAAAFAARAASALALGRVDEAVVAACHSIELALAGDSGTDCAALLATALAAAARARHVGLVLPATRLLEDASLLAPTSPQVLRARAELLAELGDRDGARRVVRELFAQDEASRKEARLVVIDAEGLEAAADAEEAARRFLDATCLDPSLGRAWDGLARVYEEAGQPERALGALDAWTRSVPAHASIAARLRAAEIALAHEDSPSAERRLRDLLSHAPDCTRGAHLLAQRLFERSRASEALDVASDAIRRASERADRAALSRLRALCLEEIGRIPEACAAWSRVIEDDPTATDAARARSAWLRAAGSWHEAASGLEDFLAAAPAAPAADLADVWLDLAQLRAGPLSDSGGARSALAECLRLRPGLVAARTQLADLTSRDPSLRGEATARHLELLERTPDRVESLHALAHIATETGRDAAAQDAHTVLDALAGRASGARLHLPIASRPALDHPVWERARRLACAASPEISRALGASHTLEPPGATSAIEAFRLAAVVAEAELAGPALVPLRDEEAGAVISTVAALAADRDVVRADGRLVNALAPQLGRTARRRLREVVGDAAPEEIGEIDFRAWRIALRDLAHAVALDATGGDVQTALAALADDETRGRSPAARELLRRIVVAIARAAGDAEGGVP